MIMVKDMKKGFTLIELLTVIVILGIIAAITVPTIVDLIRGSREDACAEQKSAIEAAAQRWHTETNGYVNSERLVDADGNGSVTIKQLREAGYLDASKTYQNPIDDSDITGKEVTISKDGSKYSYNLDLNCEIKGS